MESRMRLLSMAAVVGLAACSVKEAPKTPDTTATAAATTPATANVVNVTASEYKFEAPDSTPAGLTTFTLNNNGKEMHHITLMKLDSGKTVDDLLNGIKNMKPNTPPPGWIVSAGGPNAAAPGSSSSLTTVLEPGNYALVCFIPDAKGVPHVAHGMAKALKVTPATGPSAPEPNADITVTLKDYQFDFSKPLTAGKHTLKIVVAPGQPHEFTFFQLMPGKKAEDIPKYVEGGMQGPPPAMPLGGVSAVQGNQVSYYDVDLKPGDYAIVCFITAADGKPHFAHGMIQQIKVS